jgi:hypothetical protein
MCKVMAEAYRALDPLGPAIKQKQKEWKFYCCVWHNVTPKEAEDFVIKLKCNM